MKELAQLVLPVYGLLLVVGGLKGYQSGSKMSLYAGGGSGVAVLLLSLLSLQVPRLALGLIAALALILTIAMGRRYQKSGKMMPAGMIAGMSAVAAVVGLLGTLNAQ